MAAVRSCFFTGLLAIRPHSISLRRTVLELTFTPDDNKSFLSISPIFLGSFLLSCNNLISSLVEVFLFLPHFSFLLGANVPVVRACFKILETVDWFHPRYWLFHVVFLPCAHVRSVYLLVYVELYPSQCFFERQWSK